MAGIRELDIRELRTEDLIQVSEVHLRAFPNSALSLLGLEAVRRYYEWLLLGPHEVLAFGAFDQSKLAGYIFAGVFRGAIAGYVKKNLLYLIWCVIIRPQLIANPVVRKKISERIQAFLPQSRQRARTHNISAVQFANYISIYKGPHIGFLAMAANPEYEDTGMGTLLMRYTEGFARRKGYKLIRLTVHLDNLKAINIYTRLGFEQVVVNGQWAGLMIKQL